jgi:WD40 repeat protein
MVPVGRKAGAGVACSNHGSASFNVKEKGMEMKLTQPIRLLLVITFGLAACGQRPTAAPATATTGAVVEPTSAPATVSVTAGPADTPIPPTPEAPVPTQPPAGPTSAPIVAPPADPCAPDGVSLAPDLMLSYTGARSDGAGSSTYVVRADGSGQAEMVRGGLAASWSPNGQRLAYLTETGDEARPYALHLVADDGSGDSSLAIDAPLSAEKSPRWSPNGAFLALDNPLQQSGVIVVDAQTLQATNVSLTLPIPSGSTWAPDSSRLAFHAPDNVALNNEYRAYTVRPDGSELTRLEADTLNDFVQQWHPDGTRLLVKSGAPPGPTQIYLLPLDGADRVRLFGDQNYADPIAFSPNGQQMAYLVSELAFDAENNITGATEQLTLANADGTNTRLLAELVLDYGQAGFSAPQWSPNGRYLMYTRGVTDTLPDLYVMDVCAGGETKVASGIFGYPNWRPGVPLSNVPTIIATPPDAGEVETEPDHARRLAWAPDGLTLAASTNAGMRFYNPASLATNVLLPRPQECCRLAAYGERYLATIDNGGTGLSVFDWQSQELVFEQRDFPAENFQSAAISPDGTLLATGERFQVRLWDLAAVTNTITGTLLATFQTADIADSFVVAVGFTDNGRTLISVTQWEGIVDEWDIPSLTLRRTFRIPTVTFFTLSPGATQLIADYAQPGFELWNVATGGLIARHPTIISKGGPEFTAFSADRDRLAVWGHTTVLGKTLAVWDISSDTLLHEFGLGADAPEALEWRSAAFSPDGAILAAGDSAGTIYLYNTADWTERGRVQVPSAP